MNYFRITAYHPEHDIAAIFDSFGKFNALWELSAYFVAKGFKVLDACKIENLAETTFPKLEEPSDKIHLRAISKGKPDIQEFEYQERDCRVVTVYDRIYGKFIN